MPQLTGEAPGRITPLEELVNIPEFEAVARRKLDSVTFSLIADGERKGFDRITLRPRMMVNTTELDLSAELFGQRLFTPILVAPLSGQKRFHPEGEAATAQGAAAAKAVMAVADGQDWGTQVPVWYQVNAAGDVEAARARAGKAVAAGCKTVCLTTADWDWAAIDTFRKGLAVPLVLKGVMSADEARVAVQRGVQGIVVSSYTGKPGDGIGYAAPIEVLPGIADAVGGKIPVLIDGGFRRGSDILVALALGARAVMVGRPVLWGLAAYGAAGVQKVVEMLQTELARDMAMCGKVNVKALDRTVVKIHRW